MQKLKFCRRNLPITFEKCLIHECNFKFREAASSNSVGRSKKFNISRKKRRRILDNTAATKSCNDAYIGNFEIGYILNHVAANVMRQ